MSELTRTDCVKATDLLNELTSDVVVVRKPDDIQPGLRRPFDNHYHLSFIIQDEGAYCDIFAEYMEPAIKEFARHMRDIPMVAVHPLESSSRYSPTLCYNFPEARLPLRFTATYDVIAQGTRVTMDLFSRHVGNFYRTIINGPLHREQMPFLYPPTDGYKFDHKYLPYREDTKPYGVWVDGEDDEEDTFVRLPGLEQCLDDDSVHHYRVNGPYCYYTGETLMRELPQV